VLLACLVLFASGLSASPMPSPAMAEAAAVQTDGSAGGDLAVTASEGDSARAALPMPAESEPGAGHAPALATPRPVDGLHRVSSEADGPRTRSHAYQSCGPPR
jgi:hypothetical protein